MGTDFTADQDAHAFVAAYEAEHPDDVIVVDDAVSRVEDISSLVWSMAGRGHHEMLRFSRVEDITVDVVTNVFASRHRIARILGTTEAGIHEEYQARASRPVEPREVSEASVTEVVQSGDAVDLRELPLLTHFATDRAPYVTSGIVVAEGDGTAGNLSYHRAMVHSRTELATSLHSRGDLWRLLRASGDRGEKLPVAMVLGGHPLFMLAASARVPMSVDERDVAGGLFGRPLEVTRTPIHGIRVPAYADYVLEGHIDPDAYAEEGPFGEFTGYSSDRTTNNLFKVETLMRRSDPMLFDVVGGNSEEHLNLGRIPRESEMADKLKARFPGVVAVHYPNSGTHFHCYVKVRTSRPGEARQIMLGLLGWDPYLKTVVAVDDDVDITNDSEVLWALAAHFQPAEDVLIVDGLPGSALDPSASAGGTTSRMGLDATRGEGFVGTRIQHSEASLGRARDILARLGIE